MCCEGKSESNVKIINNFNFNIIEVFSGISLLIIILYLFSDLKSKKINK